MFRLVLLALVPALISCSGDSVEGGSKESASTAPELIRIVPDDYHAKWVGRAPDGRLFFATYPFIPSHDSKPTREFVALYMWSLDGSFDEAIIQELSHPEDDATNSLERFLVEILGPTKSLTIRAIDVAPFSLDRDGTAFGLIYRSSEGAEYVEVLPGNYMAFYPPWNGDYDT